MTNLNKYVNLHNFVSFSQSMTTEECYIAGVEDCLSILEEMKEEKLRENLMLKLGLTEDKLKQYLYEDPTKSQP